MQDSMVAPSGEDDVYFRNVKHVDTMETNDTVEGKNVLRYF